MSRYTQIAFTPAVREQQRAHGSDRAYQGRAEDSPDAPIGEFEEQFIGQANSFFLASVTETGWPYVQHRGGPRGFVHVLDERTIAFADYRGNRQYVSVGNLTCDDRVALFFVDYTYQARLKAFGHARIVTELDDPELLNRLAPADGYQAKVERAVVIAIEGSTWNCNQHIPLLLPEDTVRRRVEELTSTIAELERRLAQTRQGNGAA
ncbi:pyridoxamine 5'-phosphate oxidase family protein [Kitasatospora sp. NPDC052896]|uniref:pyridoxamine 5'-phosphate oxidase family protein n=1 Tax=Kitasatospora sp. NPDC052896 TaxID=3364061 RepID=UPI0037CA93EB